MKRETLQLPAIFRNLNMWKKKCGNPNNKEKEIINNNSNIKIMIHHNSNSNNRKDNNKDNRRKKKANKLDCHKSMMISISKINQQKSKR
jgi:hypothetical protein